MAFVPACAAQANPLALFQNDPVPVTKDGSFYVTLGAGVVIQEVPTFNVPFSLSGSTASLFQTDASVTSGIGGLTIGYRLGRLGIGNNPRIEMGLAGWIGSASKTGGQGRRPLLFISSIDGSASAGCGSCDSVTTVKIRHSEIGGVLRVKTDFRLAPRWTVTPSLGFVGSISETRYRSNTGMFFGVANQLAPNSIKETLSTVRLGGELGADLGVQATRKLLVNAGFAVSLFSMRTHLDGSDCQANNQAAALPCSGDVFATTVNSNDSRLGARVRLSLAGTYDAGWAKVSVMGFGSWDSAMPGVRNPTNATGVATAGPARIVYHSRWAYGGALMVTIPFSTY